MARPGDPIVLGAILWDYDDTKTVVATIKADGVPMSFSPIVLPNVGQGEYEFRDTANVVFPENTFKVKIRYDVYNDVAQTTNSNKHAPFIGEIDLITVATDPLVIAKLDTLTALVISHDSNSELLGVILNDFTPIGLVLSDDVVGYIKQPTNELLGFVEPVEVLGNIDNNTTNINGVI